MQGTKKSSSSSKVSKSKVPNKKAAVKEVAFDLSKLSAKEIDEMFKGFLIGKVDTSGLEPEVAEEDLDLDDEKELEFSRLKYDPSTIRVAFRQFPVDLLVKRIAEGAINFSPGFQRAGDIWGLKEKGRLIESLLIKIPLPVFYLDSSNEDKWDVIDGVQRLGTFKAFAVDKTLKLSGLEFMPELNGKGYDDLPRSLQRRFLESYVTLYLIEKGTPNRVKQSIYERINTGGATLVQQEIRHAIFQGPATKLLEEMVELGSFKTATNNGISSLRMADRECALRFVSFFLNDYRTYKTRDMDKFLSDTMERLSTGAADELKNIKSKFDISMKMCSEIFGPNAFRKPMPKAQINKALFETWSSTFAKLGESDARRVIENKKYIRSKSVKLMKDPEFIAAISTGTGDVKKVQKRFAEVEAIVKGTES